MASEMQIRAELSITNGSFVDHIAPGNITVTQNALGMGGGVQSIPTADTVVSLGTITTNGWCFLQNLDTANYIEFGPTSGGAIVKVGRLNAGEFAIFRLNPAAVLRAIAHTGACLLYTKIYND